MQYLCTMCKQLAVRPEYICKVCVCVCAHLCIHPVDDICIYRL